MRRVAPGSANTLSLYFKLTALLIPVLLALALVGLQFLSNHVVGEVAQQVTLRVGNLGARVAGALEAVADRVGEGETLEGVAAEQILLTLMSDPAVACDELRRTGTSDVLLQVPVGLGCGSRTGDHNLTIPLEFHGESDLEVSWRDDEIAAARQSQRDLSLVILLFGLVVAVITNWFAFRVVIGRPLRDLIGRIEQARNDAETARKRLWSSINTLRDGFAIFDTQDKLVVANEAYMGGQDSYRDSIEAGKSFEELLRTGVESGAVKPGARGPEAWIKGRLEARREQRDLETEFETPDGRTIVCRERNNTNGERVESQFDATVSRERERALRQARDELEQVAYLDGLTGLGNRAACERDLERRIELTNPPREFALFHFDTDHFKKVNDTMGHKGATVS